MANKIDWLESKEIDHNGDKYIVYPKDLIKYKTIPLNTDDLLVINGDEYWLKFAVLGFFGSETNGVNTKYTVIFHGEGSSGLRECRHTYWGEDGYIFYPNAKVIIEALGHLKEYFDLD